MERQLCERHNFSTIQESKEKKDRKTKKIGKKILNKLCVYEANGEKIINNEYTFTIINNRSQIIRRFKKKTGRQRAGKVVY